MNCLVCKTNQTYCFSTCDKCGIGLCEKCYRDCTNKINILSKQNLLNCKICKTKFNDFCENQTISYMMEDADIKIVDYYNKKWDSLDDNIKYKLGDPDEYLKNNFNYCDCENHSHCTILAREQIKKEFGINNFVLYEHGLDYLLCKECFVPELKFEPTDLHF